MILLFNVKFVYTHGAYALKTQNRSKHLKINKKILSFKMVIIINLDHKTVSGYVRISLRSIILNFSTIQTLREISIITLDLIQGEGEITTNLGPSNYITSIYCSRLSK